MRTTTSPTTGGTNPREARDALRVASEELAASIDDVLAITYGLPPVGLGDGGLLGALHRLAERCPIPVALTLAPDAAADADRETALFYVCSEALANTIKHARASHVSIDLRRDRAGLTLVLPTTAAPLGRRVRPRARRPDGGGGGRLRVDSPPGAVRRSRPESAAVDLSRA
jgi:signal transduction histidine kinase